MDTRLNQKFPSVVDIERTALKRLPKFIRDYVRCGMGRGGSVKRNRDALDSIRLMPRYLVDADHVDTGTTLFGRKYDAPFAVAPVGMGGLVWPDSAIALASAARTHQIPFVASTFAISSLEAARQQAREFGWFQLYRPSVPQVEQDLLTRVKQSGYEVLIVTVDVPSHMRRDHDIRNGFTVPLKLDTATAWQIASHPAWALAMAKHWYKTGYPEFENLTRYVPPGLGQQATMDFMVDLITGHITPSVVQHLRKLWNGKLVLKGILSAAEAVQARELGVDGIIVSNHGGRQLEAAPSPCEVLGEIRAAVGQEFTLIADGGVRTGLDICRMLSLGADFVMIGRPFYYAIAAMGVDGANHIMELFKAELGCTMGQLGCATIADLENINI